MVPLLTKSGHHRQDSATLSWISQGPQKFHYLQWHFSCLPTYHPRTVHFVLSAVDHRDQLIVVANETYRQIHKMLTCVATVTKKGRKPG